MTISDKISKVLHYFKGTEKTSSKLAKERLQIIIAHERNKKDKPDYLVSLQKELIDVIAKYVNINKDDVVVDLDRQEGCSILELNVTLPNAAEVSN